MVVSCFPYGLILELEDCEPGNSPFGGPETVILH